MASGTIKKVEKVKHTATVTADGVKTYGQLLYELENLVGYDHMDENTILTLDNGSIPCRLIYAENSPYRRDFVGYTPATNMFRLHEVKFASEPKYVHKDVTTSSSLTVTDKTSDVLTSGNTLKMTWYT